ncbi:alpha/beta fold hydrolase [Arthrobacter sp.]|uniref:alpha/beta fold hydrolase n=2 Tax=Arthrobacter sp. TaxID=1667 RepID=UPI0025856BA5|nr:alpha/beta fold hydrolase [Arthrobacter sp.]
MTVPEVLQVFHGGLTGRVHASRRPARDKSAPVFVLLHGIGVSHRYLRRLHRELARTGDTYSFDLPGFGGTPTPPRQLSVPEHGAFVIDVLERLGVESCVLVGHSMGAQFAVEAARLRPDLVAQLVLMGPVVDVRRRGALRQALDLALDCALFESPSANWLVLADYFRCGPRWYLTELPVMMAYPIEDRIRGVGAPVLVVRGARDPVASETWCRLLAGVAPAGRLHQVPGRGHVVQHTASGEVARAIRLFASSPERPLGATA